MKHLIKFSSVYKEYGKKKALYDININIKEGEFVFIKGETGAGKTTLLKLLLASEKVTEGNVFVDMVNLTSITKKKIVTLRQKIGFVFQDFKLIQTKNLFENIALPLEIKGYEKIKEEVFNILLKLKMDKKKNLYPANISEGEKQKIAFARAVVGKPKIILADEPTSSLDSKESDIILNILNDLNQKGTTIIFATNRDEIIRNIDKKIYFLKEGIIQ